MNEYLFFGHTIIVSIASIIALRIGKEALITFLAIQTLLANLFVTKQMMFFGFCVTCSDVFSIGASLCLNLLQEYYTKKDAIKAIWISFFCLLFYTIMTQFQIAYIPTTHDTMHGHFVALLTPMLRIIAASLIAYLVSQHSDTFIYSFIKQRWPSAPFIIKNYGSLLLSQAIDTLLFSVLGLWGIVEHLDHIIMVSYVIKVIAILCAVPFVALCTTFIRKQSQ